MATATQVNSDLFVIIVVAFLITHDAVTSQIQFSNLALLAVVVTVCSSIA